MDSFIPKNTGKIEWFLVFWVFTVSLPREIGSNGRFDTQKHGKDRKELISYAAIKGKSYDKVWPLYRIESINSWSDRVPEVGVEAFPSFFHCKLSSSGFRFRFSLSSFVFTLISSSFVLTSTLPWLSFIPKNKGEIEWISLCSSLRSRMNRVRSVGFVFQSS